MTELREWWFNGKTTNEWTTHTVSTGQLSVYARRHMADQSVLMIANISTIQGHGGARSLYREFCRDIPTIAENLLNKDLCKLLDRWGWTVGYKDQIGTMTRVNPAFVREYPSCIDENSATAAIVRARF